MQTKQVTFRNVYACAYAYMNAIRTNEKGTIILECGKGFMGDFGGS